MNLDPSTIDFVIYHANCSDGFGAAWSAWKLLGDEAEYYPATHGDPPPDVTGKNVAILDFSYSNSTTKEMIQKAESLIVIDHHKSALIELQDIENCIFDMSQSGAMLSWKYFHPRKSPPKFIKYIEDRDLWKWELPYSKEFSAAFSMIPFEFSELSKLEDESFFRDTCKKGSYILAYTEIAVKKLAEKAALRLWRGKNVYIVNSSHWISEVGAKLSPKCDFVAVWYFSHSRQEYCVSLRSFYDNVDVSEIAKEFGGGGHKKAAGFSLGKNTHIDDVFSNEVTVGIEYSD